MTDPAASISRVEVLQGTLDLIILQTLRWGPDHGYGILQLIRSRSGDVLQVETGSLYPALHRLEKQGLISAEWGISEKNQRVRVYDLTPAGRKRLVAEQARWGAFSAAIAAIMTAPSDKRGS